MNKFEINNDLSNPQFNKHNKTHFFGTMLIASLAPFYTPEMMSHILVCLSGFIVAYGLAMAWEIGDGFKPWYYDFKIKYGGDWRDWLRENLLYSDKFSLQDVFYWNFGGSLIGMFIAYIVKRVFNA